MISASTNIEAIYHGDKTQSKASLMINVYWGTEYLDDILDILSKNNVKCTFFVGGSWVVKNSKTLQKIYGMGNEIASHGYNHKDHKFLDEKQNYDEIIATHNLVKGLIGIDMKLFAPPSGSFSETTLNVANSLGYLTIMWTKDTIDWRDQNESLILSRATKNISNGDLILMHPTKATLNSLQNIIDAYKQNNIELTTVSQTLNIM